MHALGNSKCDWKNYAGGTQCGSKKLCSASEVYCDENTNKGVAQVLSSTESEAVAQLFFLLNIVVRPRELL